VAREGGSVKGIAHACFRARQTLARHYMTGSTWRQQLVYLPWLICSGVGIVFYYGRALKIARDSFPDYSWRARWAWVKETVNDS
jgi:hypothetical protein